MDTAFGWPKGTVKAILAMALLVIATFLIFTLIGFKQWELVKTLGIGLLNLLAMTIGYYFGKQSGS